MSRSVWVHSILVSILLNILIFPQIDESNMYEHTRSNTAFTTGGQLGQINRTVYDSQDFGMTVIRGLHQAQIFMSQCVHFPAVHLTSAVS